MLLLNGELLQGQVVDAPILFISSPLLGDAHFLFDLTLVAVPGIQKFPGLLGRYVR
jgi:riboflavin biosynthesis pyrimidine reductase